jgi:hypothetical protein
LPRLVSLILESSKSAKAPPSAVRRCCAIEKRRGGH